MLFCIVRALGYTLFGLGAAFVVLGHVMVLLTEGWGAFVALLSPRNLANWLMTVAVLAPGVLLLTLAKRLRPPT